MRAAKFIWLLLIVLCATLLIGVLWFLTFSYAGIIDFAITQLQRPDLRAQLISQYFTHEKFEQLKTLITFISIIPVSCIIILWVKRKAIWKTAAQIILAMKQKLRKLASTFVDIDSSTQYGLAIIIVLVTVRSFWYATHYYAQYDECWNYNYFLSNSPLNTLVAYNNYPLHNIFTFGLLQLLPDTTLIMRLPSIFFGIVNILLVFALSKQLFGKNQLALMASVIYAVLPMTVFYMLYARGVSIALTFCLLLMHYFLVKKIARWDQYDIMIVISMGVLSMYSMTTMVVFFSLLVGFALLSAMLHRNLPAMKKGVGIYLAILFFSALLYTPMLLGSGFDIATSSDYGFSNFQWPAFFQQLSVIARNQIGFYNGLYIMLPLGLVGYFFSTKKSLVLFSITLLAIPFLLATIFKLYLPARAISFMIFGYLFIIIIIIEIFIRRFGMPVSWIIVTLVILMGSYVSHTHTFMTWSAKPDKAAYEIAELFRQQDIQEIYDQSEHFSYFAPALGYYSRLSKLDFRYYTSNKNSLRFLSLEQYHGNTFAISKLNYNRQPNDTILYTYTDVDSSTNDISKNILIYSRPNHQRAAHKIPPP